MRVFLLGLVLAAVSLAAKSMDVYFLDTEGGKATLIVSPSGQTLLIDTGYGGNRVRDANRIVAAASQGFRARGIAISFCRSCCDLR